MCTKRRRSSRTCHTPRRNCTGHGILDNRRYTRYTLMYKGVSCKHVAYADRVHKTIIYYSVQTHTHTYKGAEIESSRCPLKWRAHLTATPTSRGNNRNLLLDYPKWLSYYGPCTTRLSCTTMLILFHSPPPYRHDTFYVTKFSSQWRSGGRTVIVRGHQIVCPPTTTAGIRFGIFNNLFI